MWCDMFLHRQTKNRKGKEGKGKEKERRKKGLQLRSKICSETVKKNETVQEHGTNQTKCARTEQEAELCKSDDIHIKGASTTSAMDK